VHPDKLGAKRTDDTDEKCRQIIEAYEILRNRNKRKKYDEFRNSKSG
jgi:DnaJ-class molecular chaperone